MHVEGLGVAHIVESPDSVDEGLAGHHEPGVLHEQGQHLEFLERQALQLAADGHLVAVAVHGDIAVVQGGRVVVGVDRPGLAAAHHGAHPGH